jgi:hypothetical protein
MACPGTGVAAVPVPVRVALVSPVSVVMGCPHWYSVLEFSFWNSVDGGPV